MFTALMPHAPILIPDIGRERLKNAAASANALKVAAARLVAARPETMVLISPHSPRQRRAFGFWTGGRLRGDFGRFAAPEIALEFSNDLALASELRAEAQRSGLETWEIPPQPLDHGALVPLWYLADAGWAGPIVVLSLNYPGQGGLAELGRAIAMAVARTERRIAVIASGDMSHRLMAGAPGGYHPRGGEFDRDFIACLRRGAYHELELFDPELQELAGQDVLESTVVALAAADWRAAGNEVLSYEGPFGVGYGVAVLFNPGPAPAPAAISAATEPARRMPPTEPRAHVARWWTMRADGRIECRLCPRLCKLNEGQRGFCFSRRRLNDQMVLPAYGRSSGFCVDPIEKKPLNHFFPGTSVLSFGTAGCNLGCRFCQNWGISKARETDRLGEFASPEKVAQTARRLGCKSVAFTYNDPVVFAEYAIDVAQACHALEVQTVAVTAGYMNPPPRAEFYRHIDAANVDLKGFTDAFYRKLCLGELAPVLDTLEYLHRETPVWLEVTSLLIPGENDDEEELHWAAEWFAGHLGPDVPWHFTAFHPDFKTLDKPATPLSTLEKARAIAISKGLRYVYTGNVRNPAGSMTRCSQCGQTLIERAGYALSAWNLKGGGCRFCGCAVPGRFDGQPGAWGPRRMRLS